MCAADLDELQSVLVSAMRCVDCRDPRCMNLCPEHINVRAAMQWIIAQPRSDKPSTWTLNADEAAASAMDGIEASFEH